MGLDIEPMGTCKCDNCVSLATASFYAAHTSKASNNLATFNPIDPPDPNIHPPFYNAMQVNYFVINICSSYQRWAESEKIDSETGSEDQDSGSG